jgi:hypothetical protein
MTKPDGTEPARLARCLRILGVNAVAKRTGLAASALTGFALLGGARVKNGTRISIGAVLPELEAELEEVIRRSA